MTKYDTEGAFKKLHEDPFLPPAPEARASPRKGPDRRRRRMVALRHRQSASRVQRSKLAATEDPRGRPGLPTIAGTSSMSESKVALADDEASTSSMSTCRRPGSGHAASAIYAQRRWTHPERPRGQRPVQPTVRASTPKPYRPRRCLGAPRQPVLRDGVPAAKARRRREAPPLVYRDQGRGFLR